MKVYPLNSTNSPVYREKENDIQFRAKRNLGRIGDEVSSKSKFIPKALTYLGQNDGEILNTIVTAVGTAFVAPIFIAGNPLSKEDKETKWYSAMRQPISAVITLAMQLGVNDVYNAWMAKHASTGSFGSLADLRAMPKASYLKRLIKLEHPDFDSKQIAKEVQSRQMLAERAVVRQTRIDMKDKPINYSDLLSKDTLDDAEKALKKEMKSSLKETEESKLKEIFKEKITPEMIKERALADTKKSVLEEAEAKFKIRQLRDSGLTVEEAIAEVSKKKPKTECGQKVLKDILDRLEIIKEYEKANDIKPFKSVKDIGHTYEEVLHNIKVKRLVKSRVSDASKRVAKFTKWGGIFVSLATLPISCGLLNWSYPRVMEKLMPKLLPIIHRNDKDWKPEKVEEKTEKVEVEKEDEDED